jgi:hypothetical protein
MVGHLMVSTLLIKIREILSKFCCPIKLERIEKRLYTAHGAV